MPIDPFNVSVAPAAGSAGEAHPYQALTPDAVLDALATLGLYGDGRMEALSSYENRVYRVHLEGARADVAQAVVVKFYRPDRWSRAQILEEHAFSLALAAAEVPAVAPLLIDGATLHHHAILRRHPSADRGNEESESRDDSSRESDAGDAGGNEAKAPAFDFSVSPYRGGRRPEFDDAEVLEWIGRFLARIHDVGAASAFAVRPALDAQSFGVASRDWLLGHTMVPLDVQRDWEAACNNALTLIGATALGDSAAAKDTDFARLRLHGDCHPGNILWTPTDRPDGGPHFVDLDDARTGFAVQDLWMLLSGERSQRTRQLGLLVDGYEQFREFDRRELALIEPLRTLRLLHYSAWLARRWQDPIFPINFPWFGSSDYWKGQVQMLQDQCEAMLEPALVV